MGFGLKKLQFLWTTVNEIAFENNLPVQNAVEKFLSDIEQQYDSKLGFESVPMWTHTLLKSAPNLGSNAI